MNLSAPLGILVSIAVIYYATTTGIENPRVFLDPHAAAIVLGGTLAVTFIIFPLGQIFIIFKMFLRVISGQARSQIFKTINEIVEISKQQLAGKKLAELHQLTKSPFLKEALELVGKGGLSKIEAEEVLEQRLLTQNEFYKDQAQSYKVLGKFPPAFGLIGATLGMVALLQGLGAPDAFKTLGPAMSVALVATFYGLAFANFFIIPIAENLSSASQSDLTNRKVIIDGVKLLQDKKHPLLVEEYLVSYLTPKERNKIIRTAT